MNREQARTILIGLSDGPMPRSRVAVVDVMLDLLAEGQVVVEPHGTAPAGMISSAVVDAMHKRLAELDAREKPTAPFPGSPRSMNEANAEIERLRKLAEGYEVQLVGWSKLWSRVEKLVGRDFTSPESVIDRVAFLAEVEKTRPTKQRFDELRADRNELLKAAWRVVRAVDLANNDDVVIDLRGLVERIDNNAREDI